MSSVKNDSLLFCSYDHTLLDISMLQIGICFVVKSRARRSTEECTCSVAKGYG